MSGTDPDPHLKPMQWTLLSIGISATLASAFVAGCGGMRGMSSPPGADAAMSDRIAEYIQPLVQNREFSGSVLVVRRGQVFFEGTWGRKDFEADEPHDGKSRFRIASVSKTMTAAAITDLERRGLLSKDDLVGKHLPAFVHGDRIRIRHLLRFESGLAEIESEERFTSRTLLEKLGSRPLEFEPGTDDVYGNSGFDLLGLVIEAVSRKPLGDYFRERFFDPLSMHDTGFLRDLPDEREAVAAPHVPGPPPDLVMPISPANPTNFIGSGGVYSSARDLVRWGQAVLDGVVYIDPDEYPWGWGRTESEGHAGLMQTGLTAGFAASLQVFPDEEVVVATTSNVEAGLWADWARDISTIIFGGDPAIEPTVYTPVDPPQAGLAGYTGRFNGPRDRFVVIREKGGHLWLHLEDQHVGRHLLPVDDGGFQLRDFTGRVYFERDESGTAGAFRWELPEVWNAEAEIYRRPGPN